MTPDKGSLCVPTYRSDSHGVADPRAGMLRLVAAVVQQALADLTVGGTPRKDSLLWIENAHSTAPWSYIWCCEMLGLHAPAIRRQFTAGLSIAPTLGPAVRPTITTWSHSGTQSMRVGSK